MFDLIFMTDLLSFSMTSEKRSRVHCSLLGEAHAMNCSRAGDEHQPAKGSEHTPYNSNVRTGGHRAKRHSNAVAPVIAEQHPLDPSRHRALLAE